MLHLITGTPGAGKTLYAVSLVDKYEIANKRALDFNAAAFLSNKELIEKNELADYFSSYTYFSKITKQEETVFFEPNHFDYFSDKTRSDPIFLDIKFYNGILTNIKNDLGIELKQLKFVRHIYANIDGLKVDFVRPIEVDWRICPDGSIIFYDEIQLISEYSTDNKQDKENIVKHLTVHRHRAFDIYGITQFPALVHPNFRHVVGLHYHLHRGWGAKAATVYVWANCRDKPNSLGNKLTAERDFRFNYPKRLFEVYESATADTVKLRVPLKLFAILLIPLVGLIMLGNMIFGGGSNFLTTIFGSKDKTEQVEKTNANNTKHTNSDSKNAPETQNTLANSSNSALADVCRQAVNLDKPACVKWFNDLSNSNASVSNAGVVTVSYDPSKPYDFKPAHQIQIRDYPRLTGCARNLKGDYVGIDQQGNIMQEISQSDCKKWLSGYRVFDYSKAPVEVKNNALLSTQTDNSKSDQLAVQKTQQIEYADNQVQQHLERNPDIYGAL